MTKNFPIVDRNRRVKEASLKILNWRLPTTLHLEERDGDSDFGVDAEIQVENHDSGIKHSFSVQVKGTEKPNILANGRTLSFPLKTSTLNYYASLPQEVMLVVCVVVFDADGKLIDDKCVLYWEWISRALKEIRGSEYQIDESKQKTVAIRVPMNQIVDSRLDVTEYLQRRIKKLKAVATLENIVATNSLSSGIDPVKAVAKWMESTANSPDQFAAQVMGQSDFTSIKIPEKAIEIRTLIRSGQTDAAAEALEKIGPDGFGKDATGRALWLSQSGKVSMQRFQRKEALNYFEQAYATATSEEHLLALAEVRFLSAIDDQKSGDIAEVRDSLVSVATDDCLSLLVRVQVALKDFVGAQQSVDRITDGKRQVATLVLLSGQSNWTKVIELAKEYEQDKTLAASDVTTVQLVAARAAWAKALESAKSDPDAEETPLAGAVGTDHEAALIAWQFSISCLSGLKAANWPPNTELLAPIICATAGVLGTQEIAISKLVEAADERPNYPDLQRNLELLAIGAGNTEIALKANSRQATTLEILVRRASLQFQARRFQDCLTCALEVANSTRDADRNMPMALAMGYASARKIGKPVDASRLKAAIESSPDDVEFLAFAEFASKSIETPKSDEGLSALRKGLETSPNSWLLAANLFINLDVSVKERASEAVGLVGVLRSRALLTRAEAVHEAYALSTLGRWTEVSTATRDALNRFESDQSLLSLLAVAEDMQGKTASALAVLEKAMDAGKDRVSILHNYMSIAFRLGKVESIRKALDRLLQIESVRTERMDLLRLSALVHVQEGQREAALAVAMEVGRLADQSVEDEEGMFLNLVMGITFTGSPVEQSIATEVNARIERFTKAWPESELFRTLQLPKEGLTSANDFDKLLAPLLGDPRGQLREFEKRERNLRDGITAVPFILRAGYAIHYVANVFDLWEISKHTKHDAAQFHLLCAVSDGDLDRSDPTSSVPILDLTALLLLDSLNLFDELFEVFSTVAIPKQTVAFISQHSNSLLAGGPGTASARSILVGVNKWLARIEQPNSETRHNRIINQGDVMFDYLELVKSGKWLMYCDDAILRITVRNEAEKVVGFTTPEFLALAESLGILPIANVASKLSNLVSWNVSVLLDNRYLVASLDRVVPDRKGINASARLVLFENQDTFKTLFRAIAFPEKHPSQLIQDMGSLLTFMLTDNKSNTDSVSAVAAFWFNRVRIFRVAGGLGWRLLGYPVIYAITHLPDSAAGRVVGVLRTALELSLGDQKMSTEVNDEIPKVLGEIAASIALKDDGAGQLILHKLLEALPKGTADGDNFFAAYSKTLNEQIRKAIQP